MEQLGNLATLIRFLEGHAAANGEGKAIHPAMGVLEKALPVLQRIMQSAELQADAAVFNALCEVMKGPLPERLVKTEPKCNKDPCYC